MPKAIVKAAVVQAAPVMFDTDRTLAKLAELAREAAAQRADIVGLSGSFRRRLSERAGFRRTAGKS